MQLRQSQVQGDRPCCPVDPKHAIDHHDQYDRFANCQELTKSKWIPRFLCRHCGHTISVLPDDTLPYRAVSAPVVEQCFDAKAAEKEEPPVSENEKGCLKRAWQRFTQRFDALASVLGQMMQLRQRSAKRIWTQLRRLGNLERILKLLSKSFKTSLLHDYQCLRPWSAPRPGG